MEEILKELMELKGLLQTIASSSEHKPVTLRIDGEAILSAVGSTRMTQTADGIAISSLDKA